MEKEESHRPWSQLQIPKITLFCNANPRPAACSHRIAHPIISCPQPTTSPGPGPASPSYPHLKSQSGFSSPFDLCPSHGPLLAPASASLLPWVRWEAESHIAPKFSQVPPRGDSKNDSRDQPASGTIRPGLRRK